MRHKENISRRKVLPKESGCAVDRILMSFLGRQRRNDSLGRVSDPNSSARAGELGSSFGERKHFPGACKAV